MLIFSELLIKEENWVNFGHAPARGHRDVIHLGHNSLIQMVKCSQFKEKIF